MSRLCRGMLGVLLIAPAAWGDWTVVTVDSTGDVGLYTSMAVVGGNPAIAYYDDTTQQVKYVRATDSLGTTWGAPVVLGTTSGQSRGVSLAVVGGVPGVRYVDSDTQTVDFVRALDAVGSAWATPVEVEAGVAQRGNRGMDVVAGNPALAFTASVTDLGYTRALDPSGSSWTAPVNLATDAYEGSLRVVNGNPAVIWHDWILGAINYRRAGDALGTAWGSTVTIDRGDILSPQGEYQTFAIVNGHPAVAYLDRRARFGSLLYVRADDPDGTSWTRFVTADVTSCRFTSMATVGGVPAISYHTVFGDELRYVAARDQDGDDWRPYELVDDGGTVGFHTSLVEVGGEPAISYYDATNGDLKYARGSCTATINVSPSVVPAGTVGVSYSVTFTATGGTGPWDFSALGALPPGLTIDNAGLLSGVPTAVGIYDFTIVARDATGCPGWVDVSLNIGCGACSLAISTPSLPDAALGQNYVEWLNVTGGTAPTTFTVASGSLPPGIVLEPSGRLIGVPTATGTYSFTAQVVDGCGCLATRTFSITVPCPPLNLQTPPNLPDGTVGALYDERIQVAGLSPFTWSVVGGSLPPGLALGRTAPFAVWVTGTPTQAGSFTFTLEVTDAAGCSANRDFTILVHCETWSIDPSSLPPGQVGGPYSVQLSSTGGVAPHAFALTAGALPLGLSLSSGGLLSGIPAVAGLVSFTITSTDQLGCSASRTYQLGVGLGGGDDLVVGQGLGQPNPNRVRVLDEAGTPTATDFLAYSAGQWGVNVASGRIDGGSTETMLTGPGPGPPFGPQVRGFDRDGIGRSKVNFYAYGTLRWGSLVAAADLDGDLFGEVVSGAGPGGVFGPHVRGWNFDGGGIAPLVGVSFFAYSTLKYGVNVEGGDVDGDLFDEVLSGAGPGPSFGATVRGFDVDAGPTTAMGGVNFNANPSTHGVRIVGRDVDSDGFHEIAAGAGPGPVNPVGATGFEYDSGRVAALPGYAVVPFPGGYGASVGLADLRGDGGAELLVAPGPDPTAAATLMGFEYVNGTQIPSFGGAIAPFGGRYGLQSAGGDLGF